MFVALERVNSSDFIFNSPISDSVVCGYICSVIDDKQGFFFNLCYSAV